MSKIHIKEASKARLWTVAGKARELVIAYIQKVYHQEWCVLYTYRDDSDPCISCPGLVEAVADVVFLGECNILMIEQFCFGPLNIMHTSKGLISHEHLLQHPQNE